MSGIDVGTLYVCAEPALLATMSGYYFVLYRKLRWVKGLESQARSAIVA